MNSARKVAVLLVLSGIAGCKHKVQSAAPPPAPAKVYTPTEVANAAPLPQLPAAQQLDVKQSPPENKEPPPPPKHNNHPARRKSKPDATPAQTAKDPTPAASTSAPAT